MRLGFVQLRRLLLASVVTLPVLQVRSEQAGTDTPEAPPAPPAASQPAHETVLVRITDDVAVTQEDFDLHARNLPGFSLGIVRDAMLNIVDQKHLLLYVDEHPDLITAEEVEARLDQSVKSLKLANRGELRDRILERQGHPRLFRQRAILELLRRKLAARGIARGKDEAVLRETYDAKPDFFNGARVVAYHILISFPVWATPEERRAARKQIEGIRDDLVAQRRTWEECVQESHCNTRSVGGRIGPISRYRSLAEPVARAAFSLQPGELSDVVESHLGYHLIRITERLPGDREFDEEARKAIRSMLQYQGYANALAEMRVRYPIIGVRAPSVPPPAEPSEDTPEAAGSRTDTTTRPASRRPAADRPAAPPARPGARQR